MKNITPIVAGFLLVAAVQVAYSQETVQVLAGRQRTLTVPYASQINIGDPSIATAQPMPDQRQIIITGRSEGITSLTISMPNGSVVEKMIRVLQQDPQSVITEIKGIYGGVEGVEFSVRSGEIVAEGAVYTEADLATLEAIEKRYPQIIDRVADKSEKLMLGVEVEVIELVKTAGTDLGDGTLPASTLSILSQTGAASFWSFGITDDILNRIAYWKSSGSGKVIANPKLSVTNGDTATFLAGGEVPVTYGVGFGNVALEYKEYGVRLKIVPQITGSGKISLDITAEVSNLDFSVRDRQTGAPGLLSRRVSSKGIIEEGATAMLAGIYQNVVSKNKKRIPVLGHLLPFVFSSVKIQEQKQELVVLVTPRTPVNFDLKDYPMIENELARMKNGK